MRKVKGKGWKTFDYNVYELSTQAIDGFKCWAVADLYHFRMM